MSHPDILKRMREDTADSKREERQHKLTRRQVADRLGVSTSTVRRLEFDELSPILDDSHVWRFDETEVDALAAKRPRNHSRVSSVRRRRRGKEGQVAARVFQMFARGMSLAQIVVATRQPPAAIRALYSQWSTSLEEGEWNRRRDLG